MDGPRAPETAASDAAMVDALLPVASTVDSYVESVRQRRLQFHPSKEARTTQRGYAIDPSGAAPHGAHIHAMCLSQDSSVLLSGGSDGYVRWYDLFASMNGKNMLTQNLRNSFVEGVSKGGVLTTYWGHAYAEADEDLQTAPFTPVHSLACQRDALWGVSGGETGTINLWGLRHGAGATRHVFQQHAGPVSALALDPSETHLISGGWDRGVHVRGSSLQQQWDLNTGQIVRSYPGHAGQVSNVIFRPLSVPGTHVPVADDGDEAMETDDVELASMPTSEKSTAEVAAQAPSSGPDAPIKDAPSAPDVDGDDNDDDSLFGDEDESMQQRGSDQDADGDRDADGEVDTFSSGAPKSTAPEKTASAVSLPGGSGAPSKPAGATIALPGQHPAEPAAATKAETMPEAPVGRAEAPAAKAPAKPLPKPMFGAMNVAWQSDADVSAFSQDVLLTSTLSGQVLLWDRRVDTKDKAGVRALALPANTPPWCAGVCWNHTGDKIYVGRRNETVEEWDVRMLPDISRDNTVDRSRMGSAPRYVRGLRLPRGSGPVSAVTVMPNNQHLVWYVARLTAVARTTTYVYGTCRHRTMRMWPSRLWQAITAARFLISVRFCTHAVLDASARFLLTSSGDRGWFATTTETLLMHEVAPL